MDAKAVVTNAFFELSQLDKGFFHVDLGPGLVSLCSEIIRDNYFFNFTSKLGKLFVVLFDPYGLDQLFLHLLLKPFLILSRYLKPLLSHNLLDDLLKKFDKILTLVFNLLYSEHSLLFLEENVKLLERALSFRIDNPPFL